MFFNRLFNRLPLNGWLSLLILLAVSCLAALQLDPITIHPDVPTQGPNSLFWLGTDDLGRDLLSRLGVGARISLSIGLATAMVSVGFGSAYGALAAYFKAWLPETYGPWLDELLMRWVDVLYSMPGLMVVILFSLFFGRNPFSLVLALSLFSWPDTARMIRAQVLALRQEEFIQAFENLGGQVWRLFWHHFLPNVWTFMLLSATITVPRAILTESTLSFIGLGVEPPLSSWGTLASEGWQLVRVAPHLLVFPAVLILATVLALNNLSQCLRQQTN